MQYSVVPFRDGVAKKTLFDALLDARELHGSGKIILEDHERRPFTYNRLVLASMVLGKKLMQFTSLRERVGMLMPTAAGSAVALFGLNAYGRVPAMLNFTAGVRNLISACETANIKTIISSKKFVEHGRLDDVIDAVSIGRRVIWIEEVTASISSFDKLCGMLDLWRARTIHQNHKNRPDDEAAIVFTSGSEGVPKGVVLSHRNLLSNAFQIIQHGGVFFRPDDVMFDTLPIFHAFGLTAGLLLGVMSGMKVVLYPSPLHYKQIPKLIAATKATFVFSTDTFLQGYIKAVGNEDLSCVRYIVAGAERVKSTTRQAWSKFPAVILEGYGASECSPVISVNLPEKKLDGTTGTLLPGVEVRMIPVEGVHEGGRCHVRGPNVMKGYIDNSDPSSLVAPEDGWHDTGDIVTIDHDGFITIKGRAKRFAKIGGEMVSLAAVEAMAQGVWPDEVHAAVALPDSHKGEQILILTTRGDADRDTLLNYARNEGFPELWMPKGILIVDSIPVTGMGKIDYIGATKLAESMRAMV